jgi:hypothetical protein
MSSKTRGNYPTGGYCARFDCENRDKECAKCIKADKYKKAEKKTG